MKFLMGVVVTAVVLFFWGFVFWMMMPFPKNVYRTAPQQDTYVDQLQAAISEPGAYLIPAGMSADPTDPTIQERHLAGPLVTILYRGEGAPVQGASVFMNGFLHMLVAAILAGMIVISSGRQTYFGRFMVIFWVGIFAAVWTQVSKVVWFYYPWNYCLLEMGYIASSILWMGLILAFFLKPAAEAE